MTDDCQTAVIVIAHTHIQSERLHTYGHARTHTRSVFGLFSLWCFFARRFFFFRGEFFLSFFLFQSAFVPKNFVLVFFLFRHLKSSLLKPASFCRPIFDAHKFTFLTHTRTRAPASIESAAKRDGIITAALAWNDQQVSNQI